ncbi:MAG: serine/threonine-protein kinase [Myxococcota bacterium]
MRTLARGPGSTIELVYRREGTFRRMYAVKRLAGALRRDATARARFVREGRLLGALRHPNVVAVLDVGEDAQGPFLRTDYAFGVSLGELSARLASRGVRFPPQLALRIGVAVGHALWATHEVEDAAGEPLGLVHRDLRPANVQVGFEGVVRLLGFGVVQTLADEAPATSQSPNPYRAPEQRRRGPVDGRADLYALGVLLHELLAAGLPDPSRPLGERVRCSEEVLRLVEELLADDPRNRPASAAEVTRRLELEVRELVLQEGPLDLRGFLEETLGDVITRRRRELSTLWDAFDQEASPPAVAPADTGRWWGLAALLAAAAIALGVSLARLGY